MVTFSNNGRLKVEKISSEFALNTNGKEYVVVLLSGKVKVWNGDRIEDSEFIMSRHNVFSDRHASFFVVANDGVVYVESVGESEIAIVESETQNKIHLQQTAFVSKSSVGENNSNRQVIRLVDGKCGIQHLIVGETYNPTGNWSSWPPHKHDTHEEIYHYKFSNKNGFGLQMVDDNICKVVDGDQVEIKEGYHPVVCSPYSEMYYLWVLFGDSLNFTPEFKEIDS